MREDIQKYIKEAYQWYEEDCSGVIPDAEDIAECACEFIEEDSGIELSDKEYNYILKMVKGE